MIDEVEWYVAQHGEGYRVLIRDALAWLEEKEPAWELTQPMDRSGFVRALVERAKPREMDT